MSEGALPRKLRSPCVSTVPRMTFKKKQYVIGKGGKDFMGAKEERRDYSRRYEEQDQLVRMNKEKPMEKRVCRRRKLTSGR